MTSLSDKPVFKATLSQLTVAHENMRARDDIDDGVQELAETLLAGQIEALLVRRGGPEDLYEYFILDGRRRYFGFELLLADGRIEDTHLINIVVCETPEEIAAAVVVANTSRLEVSTADYLLAINGLTRQFKSNDEIGKVLGLDAKKVKQLAALGALDIRFLEAFKRNELELKDLRQLTKVKKPQDLEKLASQADARTFKYQHASYAISQALESGLSIHATDPAAMIVGIDVYTAAGGKIESDLFEEVEDRLLDTQLLLKLLVTTLKPVTDIAKTVGLTPWVSLQGTGADPAGTTSLNWPWEPTCDKAALSSARKTADVLGRQAMAELAAGDRDAWSATIQEWMAAEIEWHKLRAAPLQTTDCTLYTRSDKLYVMFYVSEDTFAEWKRARDEVRHTTLSQTPAEPERPRATIPRTETVVETDGYQNTLHLTVTKRAGQALAATIAANPGAAFTAQLAAQFQQCLLSNGEYYYGKPDRLLTITIHSAPRASGADATFIRPIVEKLEAYVEKWQASGLHPFEWVDGLTGTDKGDLFALITALQIDTAEDKTTSLRKRTRAEAAQLVQITGHDIRDTWLPDATFYAQFSKRQLLGFLTQMGVKTKEHDKLSRDVLAQDVATFGKNARFAPAAFDFILAPTPETPPEDDHELTDEEDEGDPDVDTFDEEEIGEDEEVPA